MKEEMSLTIEMLRKALNIGRDIPPQENKPCVVLHPLEWENYKEVLNLTEEQMEKWFVKATYLPIDTLEAEGK